MDVENNSKFNKNFSVKSLKGKKGPARIVQAEVTGWKGQTPGWIPKHLDAFIHPDDNEDVQRRQEIALDLIECLKKRLKPRELEVYDYHFVQGYTQQETAVFMLVTQPYVNKILRRIVKKAKTLMKTYEF